MFDPTRNKTTNFAYQLARQLHQGQKDKSGANYFKYHVTDVARRVYETTEFAATSFGSCWTLATVALLHDTIEDTAMTTEVLGDLFNAEIVDAVIALTKPAAMDYVEYIGRIVCENRLAIEVKIHDIHSNLNPVRLHELDETTQVRLVKKYSAVLPTLYEHRSYS